MKEELLKLLEENYKIANNLCPDEEDEDDFCDGEETFDKGRGQGIFEMCQKVKAVLEKY